MFIFDPEPRVNDYLSKMYYAPIFRYCLDQGIDCRFTHDLDSVKNSTVLIHGDRLSPTLISQIKNNGNKLVIFDINDSSYFSSMFHGSPETELIDLVFKVSGIPKTNVSLDPSIDRNFGITSSEVRYLPEDQWEAFRRMKEAGKIHSLPYVLWTPLIAPGTPLNGNRSGKAIVRGGNHFWRFVLFMRLMQQGWDDPNSMFATEAYFQDTMIERFRYCDACVAEMARNGKSSYDTQHDYAKCKSPATWGIEGEVFGGPAFGRNEFGWWNNRCPASFYWMAKEYERNRGPLNKAALEHALNGRMASLDSFISDLSGASFHADYKWLLTIYVPPRFWEAASLGTVNLLPQRTDDQDYFPVIKPGVHYLTFPEDMSEFNLDIPEVQWKEISNNAKEVYETSIRGTKYEISTNLLKYIVEKIV